MEMVYPNGAHETLTPLAAPANAVSVSFTVPKGSKYVVTASPGPTAYSYGTASVVWSDGTTWNFQPPAPGSNKALLSSIVAATSTAATPQFLTFNWVGDDRDDYRLVGVNNGSDLKRLLSLQYTGNPADGFLLNEIRDCYGRSIFYSNGTLAGTTGTGASAITTLTGVSMFAPTGGTANQHFAFGYTNFNGAPLLSGITVPHPNDPTLNTTATATINYDSTTGRVLSEVDGNGNTTSFTYGATSTTVKKFGTSGVQETQYTALFDAQGRSVGTTDAAGNSTAIAYGDTNNPDKPTIIRDAAGRVTSITYEPNGYGLVKTVKTPRGVTTNYLYDYSVWGFGLLAQTYQSTVINGATVNRAPTQFSYKPGFERAGLVSQISSPHPNLGISNWTGASMVFTTMQYNDYGDVTMVVAPGHGSYANLTTTISYTSDGTYTQSAKRGQVVSATDPSNRTTAARYDARGNRIWSRDGFGVVTQTTFDLADNAMGVQFMNTGQSGTYASQVMLRYNYLGGMVKTTDVFDESGSSTPIRSVSTTFDGEGRAVSVSGSTEPFSVSLNSFDAPKSSTDGNGNTTTYSYDARGLPTMVVKPNGNTGTGYDVTRFTSYAPDGQLLSQTDGRGITTNFTYGDPDGAVSSISLPDETVSFGRDAWGRLSYRFDSSGNQSYAYTETDAPSIVNDAYKRADGSYIPGPGLLLYHQYYDDGTPATLFGNPGTATAPINLLRSYDPSGNLTGIYDYAQSLSSSWSYDANNRLQSASAANGWARSYAYNALNQLVGLTGSKSGQPSLNFGHPSDPNLQLKYDGAGNMTRETANFGTAAASGPGYATGTTSYGYDSQDRLTGESSNRFGGQSRTYSLDAAFNRTNLNASNGTNAGQTLSSFTRTQGANGQNQTLGTSTTNVQSGAQTNTSYSYDGEGNRATYADGSQVLTYTYDSQQRLTAVTKYTGGAGQVILKCGYRCDGLRAWKETGAGVRTYFLYDGDQLIGEFDQNGVVKAVQTWGAEGLASRQTTPGIASGNRFYSWDPRGNIAATTDLAGNVVNTPSSDGFSSTGGTASEPTATFGGQVGGYRDAETGLILFGQRYYDPALGQWLTRDPIGEDGGINLYSYVGGNPVNDIDPWGLYGAKDAAGDLAKAVVQIAGQWGVERGWQIPLGVAGATPVGVFAGVLLDAKPAGGAQDTMTGHNAALQQVILRNTRTLRGWAKSKGWMCKGGGGPEQWGVYRPDGSFSWRLKIKQDPSSSSGLSNRGRAGQAGSYSPRFDARLNEGTPTTPNVFVNPFTGATGGSILSHQPLDRVYP